MQEQDDSSPEITDYEKQWIVKLKSQKWSSEELTNLHRNAIVNQLFHLADAIHERLRIDYPRVAKKTFGGKDEKARKLLDIVYQESEQLADLSKNRIGNGVKTGGLQRTGKKHINVYISYRNAEGLGIALGLLQDTASDPMTVEFVEYKVGRNKYRKETSLPFSELGRMSEQYKEGLAKLID
jgi:hypothetical protein